MQTIFISYRRDDAEGQAGRLYKDLAEQFGEESVFMDVSGIQPGRDFRKVIDQHVSSCTILLAVIGKRWLDAKDEAGRRRLDSPTDFVRLETASALKRDIPVIPVLVQGAEMVQPADLPPDLTELAFRNNFEITHTKWDSDVEVLVASLRTLFEGQAQDAGAAGAETDASASAAPRKPAEAPPIRPLVGARRLAAAQQPAAALPWAMILGASAVVIAAALGGYRYFAPKLATEDPKVVEAQNAAKIAVANAATASANAAATKSEAEVAQAKADKTLAELAIGRAESQRAQQEAESKKAAADAAEADRRVSVNASAAQKAESEAAAAKAAKEKDDAQRIAQAKADEAEKLRASAEQAKAAADDKALKDKVAQVEAERTASLVRQATQIVAVAQAATTGGAAAAVKPAVVMATAPVAPALPGAGANQPRSVDVRDWKLASGGCGAGSLTVIGTATFTIEKTVEGVLVSERFNGSGNGFDVTVTGNRSFPKAQQSYEIPTTGTWKGRGAKAFTSTGTDRVIASDGLTPSAAHFQKLQSQCGG